MTFLSRLRRTASRQRSSSEVDTSRRTFLVGSAAVGVAAALPALGTETQGPIVGTEAQVPVARTGGMLKPAALRPGDPVAVIAPSSPVERDAVGEGIARLARRYKPLVAEGLYATDQYLAGTDAQRVEQIRWAFGGEARAVFVARGGYGAARLLPDLDFDTLRRPLVGLSDATALHAGMQRSGTISIHGQCVVQLGHLGEAPASHLWRLLEDPGFRPSFAGTTLVEGPIVEGRVVGGNLSVFSRLVGTPWLPNLDGAILFLEDMGEAPYRIDRMWQQLRQAGCLDKLAGIVLGTWRRCDDLEAPLLAETVLSRLAGAARLPCLARLPCGHGPDMFALALGARARLDTRRARLEFLEGAVA